MGKNTATCTLRTDNFIHISEKGYEVKKNEKYNKKNDEEKKLDDSDRKVDTVKKIKP